MTNIGCWIMVMLAAASATLAAPARAEFTAITGWERQLFPSYIIATAALRGPAEADPAVLGDPRGLLGATVTAPQDGAPVKVTIQCDEILQASEFSGVLAKQGETYQVFPKIKFRYQALAQFDQAASVNVTFRVQVGDAAAEEQTVTLTVRSINDCPFVVLANGQTIDTSFAFAAYVNEQHPFVDKLLREALDIGMVDKFTGYQDDNPTAVLRQAYALWDLLVSRDMCYSSITATAASAETVASQHVRLLEDSVNHSQANCVDGSVLLVSLLRKIGIEAFLVIEPGHCYAGFFADRQRKVCYAIETTLLGEAIELDEDEIPAALDDAIDYDDRDDETFHSFVAAIQTGTARFGKQGQKFADPKQTKYRVIDITAARQAGILPIAFQGKQEFVDYDHSERFAEEEDEESEEDESEEGDWEDEEDDESDWEDEEDEE